MPRRIPVVIVLRHTYVPCVMFRVALPGRKSYRLLQSGETFSARSKRQSHKTLPTVGEGADLRGCEEEWSPWVE